ncbi:MAG: redoxin domain-containing protein [Bryobacteraceae bacterium]|nr:redoxin domain-containing protein [Bryobacteraceae bacterium]
MTLRFLAILLLPLLAPAAEIRAGHSHKGEPFDSGPRTKPAVLTGIGATHFPITHRNPEVQKWFNQGNTLLHSFSDFEAERSFRWCLKLEPDNAMCYWGLARAAGDERSEAFILEAAKRKASVSERERLYIDALVARDHTDRLRDRGDDYTERNKEYKKILETLCLKYPEDDEARLLLAMANMGDARYGTELVLREVQARQPSHPGVHHYRIHNWNYHEPEAALDSCARYGSIAPGLGHALHMPGHIYAQVGMWQEAAIAMDSATRVEVKNMHAQQVFPFNYWNWGHNRHYLNYIQEQLGQPEAAIAGARELIRAPQDPNSNGDAPFSPHSQGIRSLARSLVKYERWTDLLDAKTIPWREIPADKLLKAYVEARAHFALGNRDDAEKAMKELAKLDKEKAVEDLYRIMTLDLKARLALSKGETLLGLGLLSEAADKQYEAQKGDNDPPAYPEVLFNALGRAYLENGSKDLAIRAFQKALTLTRNDRFALAGLEKAGQITAPHFPRPQRPYDTASLASFGPDHWTPFLAPALDAQDVDGKARSLTAQKGRNTILVFYLGRECLHCLKQLRDLRAKAGEWKELDTDVFAVSPNAAAANKALLGDEAYQGIHFLSDPTRANAKRFLAYDDFEEMEIHATILIDKQGQVRWSRLGGAPFADFDFLKKELARMNENPGL